MKLRELLKIKAGHGTTKKILETTAMTHMRENRSKDQGLITSLSQKPLLTSLITPGSRIHPSSTELTQESSTSTFSSTPSYVALDTTAALPTYSKTRYSRESSRQASVASLPSTLAVPSTRTISSSSTRISNPPSRLLRRSSRRLAPSLPTTTEERKRLLKQTKEGSKIISEN